MQQLLLSSQCLAKGKAVMWVPPSRPVRNHNPEVKAFRGSCICNGQRAAGCKRTWGEPSPALGASPAHGVRQEGAGQAAAAERVAAGRGGRPHAHVQADRARELLPQPVEALEPRGRAAHEGVFSQSDTIV